MLNTPETGSELLMPLLLTYRGGTGTGEWGLTFRSGDSGRDRLFRLRAARCVRMRARKLSTHFEAASPDLARNLAQYA